MDALLLTTTMLVVTSTITTVHQAYEANGQAFDSCTEALTHAKLAHEETTVSCHTVQRVTPDEEPLTTRRLRDYRPIAEIVLENKDASGVTFVEDDVVLITYQSKLEFRRIDGTVISTIDEVSGDVEGLEMQGDRLIAVAEVGSTHIELMRDGMELETLEYHQLDARGVECIASDPETGTVYYGQESSGDLFDDTSKVVHSFSRDLSGCTVFGGELLAITSHPWRRSEWHRVNMTTWAREESLDLPPGDWEGVACRGDKCVLVRESSEKSTAALLVLATEGTN